MDMRKLAFEAGVLRSCKEAGYDVEDATALSQLLLMPAHDGAQALAHMVLNKRDQQVKAAGEFLVKRAKIAITQEEFNKLTQEGKAPDLAQYNIVSTQDEADRLNQMQETQTASAPTGLTEASSEARTQAAAGIQPPPATDEKPYISLDSEKTPMEEKPYLELAPETKATTTRLDPRYKDPTPEARAEAEEAAFKELLPDVPYEGIRELGQFSQAKRLIQRPLRMAGVKFRPGGQRFGGPALDNPKLEAIMQAAQRLDTTQRALNERVMGRRESAGDMFSGFRSGAYAPQAARGRQGRAGVLANRGTTYPSVAAPTAQPTAPHLAAARPATAGWQVTATPTTASAISPSGGRMTGAVGGATPPPLPPPRVAVAPPITPKIGTSPQGELQVTPTATASPPSTTKPMAIQESAQALPESEYYAPEGEVEDLSKLVSNT